MSMIAMPKIIPAREWNALSLAIARGATDQVQTLVEEHGLDVNACLDDRTWMPVLMEALLSNGPATEADRLPLLRYLLKKGANPNICCVKGYNCLHIAVQQERYIHALELFLDQDADVNVVDQDGSNIVYWAIQGFLLRHEHTDERAVSLRVLEKILLRGADLDRKNKYEMNARGWLEHAATEVRDLVARWEASKPAVRPVYTVQPKFPTNLRYPGVAQAIWNGDAPAGPASELLRAVETLREEAQLHRNTHYKKDHKRMAVFVRETLVNSALFDADGNKQIRMGTERLMKASRPCMEDAVYDQLVDQVCVYYEQREGVGKRSGMGALVD
ncbi:MAG TPA: ankyrin repeat domain-containing protein [Puia sp.]